MGVSTLVVSKEDAYDSLIKYFQKLVQSIIAANEELRRNALVPQSRAKAKQRSVSSIMNDIVSHNLRDQLSDYPDIKFLDTYGQLRVIFPEGFLMKMKQSRRKRLSFISTQSMFDFMNQLSDMLPGMPSMPTNVILTFQFNKTRTEIESVAILCPSNE